MKDDYEATFVVDLAPDRVWEALTRRTVEPSGDGGGDEAGQRGGPVHYVLAGFPSFEALGVPGASCAVIEVEEERLLRVKKDHEPCAGTEIVVTLEHAESGTRVTVVQSGFGPFLDFAGRDTVFGHGDQIVRDLRLYLERGITVPGTAWGANLGAQARQTPVGVELFSVAPDGFAARAGMQDDDLLLTLGRIRLHDLQQLWTVLALTDPEAEVEASWARGETLMTGKASFVA